MGMSASQVRFLSLKSRKNTIGRELSMLSNKKLSLSRDMNKVSRDYTNALNKTMLKWSNDSGINYNALSYDLMMKPNDLNSTVPYIVSTRDGRAVVDTKDNLIGRIYNAETGEFGEWGELTGKTFSDKVPEYLNGQTVNYENIAKWISGENNLYTTTDGLLAGRAGNSYDIPKGALDYGFENTLRYQIFEELGIVSEGTTDEYTALLNKVYGDQNAKDLGNYRTLLLNYVDMAKSSDTSDIRSITSLNIGDQEFGEFSKYFGEYDAETGKITGGCAMGNLALAEYALEEYEDWCNELKVFNLTETTYDIAFTTTSGRHSSWDVQPFLKMNNDVDGISSNADDDGGIANDFDPNTTTATADDGKVMTVFDKSLLTQYGDNLKQSIVDNSWYDIYTRGDSDVPIVIDGKPQVASVGAFILKFCEGLMVSMEQGDSYAGTTGTAWKLSGVAGQSDMVSDGEGGQISVTAAAQKYAALKTTQYYNNLTTIKTRSGSCYQCHGNGYFLERAADKAQEVDSTCDGTYNGYGGAKPGTCFWHSIADFFGGVFGSIFTGVWGGLTWMFTAGQKANWNALGSTFGLFDGVFQNWEQYSTLNMANVEKTYFTYYEMFMEEYLNNGINLLDIGDATAEMSSGITKNLVNNNNANGKITSGVLSAATLSDYSINPSSSTITYTAGDYNGRTYNYTTSTIENKITGENETVTEFDLYWGKFNTTIDGVNYTGKVIKENDGTDEDGDHMIKTTIKFDQTLTAKSNTDPDHQDMTEDKQYNKIIIDKNGQTHYYMDSTEVSIKRIEVITTDEYGTPDTEGYMKIDPYNSFFSKTIHAYINEDAAFKNVLQKDYDDALKDLEDLQIEMKNFFAGKESKMMDFYDAIFQRISENGWVSDPKVSSNTIGKEYINNKLQNNDYFVTVCSDKADDSGYNFTNKMATSVVKIFEVNDDSEQMQALSKYESDKTLISSKEKKIDARMMQLETEQEAINTELESVKTIISDNVKKTFKMFA